VQKSNFGKNIIKYSSYTKQCLGIENKLH